MLRRLCLCLSLCLAAIALAAPPVAAPTGWLAVQEDSAWRYTPENLAEGTFFTLILAAEGPSEGTLAELTEFAWASLADGGQHQIADGPTSQQLGDWEMMLAIGQVTKDDAAFFAQTMVARANGTDKLAFILFESVETYERYLDPAMTLFAQWLGASGNPGAGGTLDPGNTPGGALPTGEIRLSFPAGWQVSEQNGIQVARLVRSTYSAKTDQWLFVRPIEAAQGTMLETFQAIWQREMAGGGITMMDPGVSSPAIPSPLRIRLPNGLVVWFEGGLSQFPECGYSYSRLFMIEAGNAVKAIIQVSGCTSIGPNEEDLTTPWAVLFESQPEFSPAPNPIFGPEDLAGSYEIFLTATLASYYSTATGAYVGDASSGGQERLVLNPDGSFQRSFAGSTPGAGIFVEESGVWSVTDHVLRLEPTSRTVGSGALEPAHYTVWGYGAQPDGTLELLLGAHPVSTIPSDSGEHGQTLSVAGVGSVLLRYKRQ